MGWLRKYAIPYSVSTLGTYFGAEFAEAWKLSVVLTILLEWFLENGSYYASAAATDRFLGGDEKIFQPGSESLKQLAVVEGIDSSIRFALLFLATLLPAEHQSLGAGLATAVADVSFALTLSKSHRLLEIAGVGLERLRFFLGSWHDMPEPLVLN